MDVLVLQVHGVVFTLDWNDWMKICRTEGVPFGYVLEPVSVCLYGGATVEAFSLRAAPAVRCLQ